MAGRMKTKRAAARILSGSGGFTVVSVITAFAVLLIGIAMLTTSVATANSIAAHSEIERKASEDAINEYYEQRISGVSDSSYSDITVDIKLSGILGSEGGSIKERLGTHEPLDGENSRTVYWFEKSSSEEASS